MFLTLCVIVAIFGSGNSYSLQAIKDALVQNHLSHLVKISPEKTDVSPNLGPYINFTIIIPIY